MIFICIIWGVFSVIFFALAALCFSQAKKKVPKFEHEKRAMKNAYVFIKGEEIDAPLNRFIDELNRFIENFNISSTSQNKLSAWGYIAAGLVSIASLLIGLASTH